MKNLTWRQARALAKFGTPIRCEPWERWLLFRRAPGIFAIPDADGRWRGVTARGLGADEAEPLAQFTRAEFERNDWTDEVWEGGSLPPLDLAVRPPSVEIATPTGIITASMYAVTPLWDTISVGTPDEDPYPASGEFGGGLFIKWSVSTGAAPAAEIVGRLMHEDDAPITNDEAFDAAENPLRGYPLHGQIVGDVGLSHWFYRGTTASLITDEQPLGTGYFTTGPGEKWYARLGVKLAGDIIAECAVEYQFPLSYPG